MEKETSNRLAFLDVLVDNTAYSPTTSAYHKTIYTGLLTNFSSFSSHSYKVELVKTLVDRTYKINNTWQGFHKDIENLIITPKSNMLPSKTIDRVIKQYLNNTSLASTSFVKSNTGSSTESVATATLALYVGETCRHFSTRVREHISWDNSLHIYKHLLSSSSCCKELISEDSFTILDTATSSYQLKIKEALHISWLKPDLNSQLTHSTLTLSI